MAGPTADPPRRRTARPPSPPRRVPQGPPAAAPRVRGRPRSAEADAAIIEAVLRLIEDGATISDLSMERIAREAGVGKATVYRRWPGKEALMIDVMRSLDADPEAQPSTGSVRDDLVRVVEFVRRRGLAKRNSALLRTVIAQMQAHPRCGASTATTS
ncbi:helix-turn-helix domain-containing protein [Streptomyces sp. M19]